MEILRRFGEQMWEVLVGLGSILGAILLSVSFLYFSLAIILLGLVFCGEGVNGLCDDDEE